MPNVTRPQITALALGAGQKVGGEEVKIEEIRDNWFKTGRILACEIDECINNSVGYAQLNPGEDELQEDGQVVWLCQRHFSGVLRGSIKEVATMRHVDGPLFN